MLFEQQDAPILIVLGQSNAHGHGTKLPEALQITTPLTHVYGLARKENQAYGLQDVVWSGFTTCDMNLGETQDHTFCLAERFARRWQSEMDGGNLYALPDLHVIQISIGAQGIHRVERDGINMWYPDRPPVLIPGDLRHVNISLYPLAVQIIQLAMRNLKNAGKNPCVIGMHWNQWETEVDTGGEAMAHAEENYGRLFTGLGEAVGAAFPLYLYKPLCELYDKPREMAEINRLFDKFVEKDAHVCLMDLRKSILWNTTQQNKGIFQQDLIHYLPAAHQWFSDMQFWDLISRPASGHCDPK